MVDIVVDFDEDTGIEQLDEEANDIDVDDDIEAEEQLPIGDIVAGSDVLVAKAGGRLCANLAAMSALGAIVCLCLLDGGLNGCVEVLGGMELYLEVVPGCGTVSFLRGTRVFNRGEFVSVSVFGFALMIPDIG